MIDDQLSPQEQNLVQQIQAAPKPELDPVTRATIRQRVLSEFQVVSVSALPHPASARPRFSVRMSAAFAVAAVIVIAGVVVAQLGNQNNDGVAESSTMTTSPGILLSPPSTQEMAVIIEGPVTSIADNVVTIYGFSIEVEPQNPILSIIDVGDVVRVQGNFGSDDVVIASTISNVADTATVSGSAATVRLDGVVEAVNGTMITVNSIPVQLAFDDPLLQTIQVGNFVSVQGNFQTSGSQIVLVVVNIVIVNNTAVQSNCWYHDDGMGMGHWHCESTPVCWFHDDGMGMGHWHCDGMGMGMGMGDDGMGMGD